MNSKSNVGESKLISNKSDVPVYILFLLSTNAQDVLAYVPFSNGKVVPVEDSADLLLIGDIITRGFS